MPPVTVPRALHRHGLPVLPRVLRLLLSLYISLARGLAHGSYSGPTRSPLPKGQVPGHDLIIRGEMPTHQH